MSLKQRLLFSNISLSPSYTKRRARWLSGRASDSGARDPGFEPGTGYNPESDGPVPT